LYLTLSWRENCFYFDVSWILIENRRQNLKKQDYLEECWKWFRETGKNEPIKVCNNVKKVVQKVIPKFSVCNLSKRGAIYFVTSKTLKDEVWEFFFWMNMVPIDLRIWEYQFEGTLKISVKRHCLNQCIGKDLNLLGEKN